MMKVRSKDVSVLSYANGFTIWHYKADEGETSDVIMADGFFDSEAAMFRACDLLICPLPSQGNRVLFLSIIEATDKIVKVGRVITS